MAAAPVLPLRTRILVADDHALVRAGLSRLLQSRADFEVVGEAADGEEAVSLAVALAPDVVLMDLAMPRKSGIEAIRTLAATATGIRVLVVSQLTAAEALDEALRAGAHGFVAKHASPDELLRAVDAVRSGSPWCSPDRPRDAGVESEVAAPSVPLSARERQVLTLLAGGLSSREIAAALRVSPRTVDTHRVRMMKKLDLHKAPQLVRFAIRAGLVAP